MIEDRRAIVATIGAKVIMLMAVDRFPDMSATGIMVITRKTIMESLDSPDLSRTILHLRLIRNKRRSRRLHKLPARRQRCHNLCHRRQPPT